VNLREPSDLVDVQGRYSGVFPKDKIRRDRALIQASQDRWIYTCIAYRGFVGEASKLLQWNCDIAINDIPTSPEPSINWDACQEIQRNRSSEHRRFRRQETLVVWNHETRYPDGIAVCGPQEVSGGQVAHSIGDQEKEGLESIDIRIRDPANPEIPIEGTGPLKGQPHVCVGVSAHRGSEFGNSIC
jgi:hypothetical protein